MSSIRVLVIWVVFFFFFFFLWHTEHLIWFAESKCQLILVHELAVLFGSFGPHVGDLLELNNGEEVDGSMNTFFFFFDGQKNTFLSGGQPIRKRVEGLVRAFCGKRRDSII